MDKKGLALGGGAVLGAAHVGVLRALSDRNVDIDCITGTSIGAFIAAFHAFGKSPFEIEKIADGFGWLDITSFTLSRYSLLSNDKLGDVLIKHLGDRQIEDAHIPLSIVTTDAASGEKVVLQQGSLAEAVMASACIPGVYSPIELNGRMLIDGGIVENVPINTARSMGADFVIGVDLNASHDSSKPKHILDVILNSFHFIMTRYASLQNEDADLLIQPDLSKFNRTDMDQVEALIEQGYADALEALVRLP